MSEGPFDDAAQRQALRSKRPASQQWKTSADRIYAFSGWSSGTTALGGPHSRMSSPCGSLTLAPRLEYNGTSEGWTISDFYGTLAQVSFTVFGLWLVVVQLRRREWAVSRQRRLGAQGVALHFALPGIMSLLNLANPDSSLLWRTSFVAFASMGAAGMALLDPGRNDESSILPRVFHWVAVGLYTLVAFVAFFADVVAFAFGVNPLQVEAVLLSLLLFLGLNLSFSLLFRAPTSASDEQSER